MHHDSSPAGLTALLLRDERIEALLDGLVTLVPQAIPGVVACGLTVECDGQPVSIAVSDGLAARVDQIQYGDRVGPCVAAMRDGHTVEITSMADETRFADFPAGALRHGVRSSLSIPLRLDSDARGALNLYAGEEAAFDASAQAIAARIAQQVGDILALAIRDMGLHAISEQLRAALATRTVIGQATGILMVRHSLDADCAFELLRGASQRENIKVRVLAEDVIHAAVDDVPPQWVVASER